MTFLVNFTLSPMFVPKRSHFAPSGAPASSSQPSHLNWDAENYRLQKPRPHPSHMKLNMNRQRNIP